MKNEESANAILNEERRMKNEESADGFSCQDKNFSVTAAANSSFFILHSSFKNYIPVLTIAGSDSGGGAGIQADIKTMSALGCYATSAITAITVQNTLGVTAIQAVEPDIVAGQIRAVMEDIRPRAVKIGMVNDAATVSAIADTLRGYSIDNLIIDPVMVSTSGSRLMRDDALDVLRTQLMPICTLLTPNLPETEVIADMRITDKECMDEAAERIKKMGCRAVLIKGGHIAGRKIDRLYEGNDMREYACDDVPTHNTHGTGCTLSAAIASFLALGLPMTEAISHAKDYVTEALKAGADVKTGDGHGPVNHFFDPKALKKI